MARTKQGTMSKKLSKEEAYAREIEQAIAKMKADKSLAVNQPKWLQVGRPRKYETPELLWAAACEYFQYVESNQLERVEAIKAGNMAGMLVSVPVRRPFTKVGMQSYLGLSSSYLRDLKADKEFSAVLELIDNVIETQQLESALAGLTNAMLTSRLLGLVDKQAVEQTGDMKATFSINVVNSGIPLSSSESEVEDAL